MNEKPLYGNAGACPNCKFLGTWKNEDLYFCPQGGYPTLLIQHSKEPSDSSTGLAFGEAKYWKQAGHQHLPEFWKIAYERAYLCGLLKAPDCTCEVLKTKPWAEPCKQHPVAYESEVD